MGRCAPKHGGTASCCRVGGHSVWQATTLTLLTPTTIFAGARGGGIASFNGGGDFFPVGGHFTLSGNHAGILPPAPGPLAYN